MKLTKMILVLFALLALPFALSSALAQEEGELMVAEGKLVRVDPDAQVITLQTADQAEVDIHYDSGTEVRGADGGVAGLIGSAGTQLRVHFRSSEGAYVAETIEVIG